MKTTKLEKFLINRNLLESFDNNMKQCGGESHKGYYNIYSNRYSAIDRGFLWARSYEGFEFWKKISKEWQTCLENNTL